MPLPLGNPQDSMIQALLAQQQHQGLGGGMQPPNQMQNQAQMPGMGQMMPGMGAAQGAPPPSMLGTPPPSPRPPMPQGLGLQANQNQAIQGQPGMPY